MKIKERPLPLTNIKDFRAFLGLTSYCRKFIRNYAHIAEPLYTLLNKKNTASVRTSEMQHAAECLKKCLCEAPVLILPDTTKEFFLNCDASSYAIGAVLSQWSNNTLHSCASFSKKLSNTQRNYPTPERKFLSVVSAVHEWQVYLIVKPFTVFTDHLPLQFFLRQPYLNARMLRWTEFLAQFNFNIKYKTGKSNVVAQALSRRPDYAITDAHTLAHTEPSAQVNATLKLCYNSLICYLGLLQSIPISTKKWKQITLDFIMPLPKTARQYTTILVFVDKLTEFAIFVATHHTVNAFGAAKLFIANVFRFFGMPL